MEEEILKYDFSQIEAKWQKKWDEKHTFAATNDYTKTQILRAGRVPLSVADRACTSAIRAPTPRWISSPESAACRATTSCTRWAGTLSACRPRTYAIKNHIHPEIVTRQ